MNPQWWSQRFAAEGGAAAEGISKQLGRPSLDPLVVLVRESAQNSWDARHSTPVEFTIEIGSLGVTAAAWRRLLLPWPVESAAMSLDSALRPDGYFIRISDRNTRGLGGPLRSDEKAPDGTVANFVQFLRNVGEPSDREGGGGTYGFGKNSLYGVSAARTILVDSHCVDGGAAHRRLMASSLGYSYYDGSVRYTGRHWWGVVNDGIPDPVLGAQAAKLASDLGLPGFDDGRPGTDIVVVGALLGRQEEGDLDVERSPAEAATFIMSALLWNLWPKFGSRVRERVMDFRLVLDGRELEIPSPEAVPYLAPFVASLDKIHLGEGRDYTRTVAPRRAGSLAYDLTTADPMGFDCPPAVITEAMPFSPPFHHVARMRATELVVDYLAAPAPADPLFGYAGVFRADADAKAEQAFAASEPPAHDDWVERGLSGTDLGVVRGARKFIRDTLAEQLAPRVGNSGDAVDGLGTLAAELAGLIPTATGNAPFLRDSASPTLNRTGAKRPHVRGEPRVVLIDGDPYVVARVVVPPGPGRRRISATAVVVLEGGGSETQPPLGALLPRVIAWRRESDSWQTSQSSLEVEPNEDSDWEVLATWIPDAVTRISVDTQDLP